MAELTVAQKDAEIARLQTELAKKEEELKKKKEEDESEISKNTGDGGVGPLGPQPTRAQHVHIYYPVPYYVDLSPPPEEIIPASKPVDDHCAAILGDKNNQPKDDPTCTSIPIACAETLEEYFWKINARKDISATLKECKCPENCECLKPMDINEEVKCSMKYDDNTKKIQLCVIFAQPLQKPHNHLHLLGES